MSGLGTAHPSDTEVFQAGYLEEMTARVLAGLGAPQATAKLVADSLVLSNLLGHDSHGIIRLLQYSRFIEAGQVKPAAEPVVGRRKGAVAVVDGQWGFGQPAAQLATSLAIEMAGDSGVAALTIDRANHVGRLGEYVAVIASAGMVGLSWCNSGPAVAPFGGAGRVMGTNPFAWAVPSTDGATVVLDFATSSVAEGKLVLARAAGRAIPSGLIVDAQGKDSTDPNAFYEGGALLTFGGHKGSALSIMIELAGGILSGMGGSPMPDYQGGNGTVILALDVDAFMPLEEYTGRVAEFLARAKKIGAGPLSTEVLMPGEIEEGIRRQRLGTGIPVADEVRRQITELAATMEIDLGNFGLS